MTIHESTKSYITFGTVQQLVESARKLFIASKKVNNMDKNNASSSSVTTVEQVKVVDKNPRKLHIIEETPVSTESKKQGTANPYSGHMNRCKQRSSAGDRIAML